MSAPRFSLITAALLPLLSNPASADPLTRDTGAPVGDNQNSQTAGPDGPVLLQDSHLIEKLARFDRERIPERVVHARGTAAYGTFVSYDAQTDLTKTTLLGARTAL